MSFETNGRISQLRKPIYLYVLYYPHLSPASSKKNFFFYQSQENKQGGRYWKWKGLRYETLDMSDILYDDNINSLNNESSKQEVEKKDNDDDDQLSDEIDQSWWYRPWH